ncbi:MAG: sigma 54-interacting transcriptional regulator [Candidatus Dependentiae bacterium]
MVLRFLNFENHVQTTSQFNFIDNFKDTLAQLSQATNLRELSHIAQTFFKQALEVPTGKTTLYFRANNQKAETELPKVEHAVEALLNSDNQELNSYLLNSKILIYDEIDFTNFYEQTSLHATLVSFLESINADVFIPIYKDNTIIAYIVVDRFARPHKFYDNVDRDEMIIFASYLGNVINLLQHRNLETLIHQEKELKEELYHKHQEINYYKESIRSFLRLSKHKEIGVVFYKQRRFIFGNKSAKDLIGIDLNNQDGHPLTKALRHVAQQVEEYKSPQTSMATDIQGNKLIICGMPNLERNNVILTVYYPDITDVILKQINLLKDPSKWDYLLYLETTKQGQLINQLIPGSSETLLNFKISLLEIALSKKALLIDMPTEDLIPTIELIHHINMRETLHVLNLQNQSKGNEILITLFGSNPLYSIKNADLPQKPLLEKLNGVGTLYIENIHFLDLETQENLAEFIKYGYYRPYKANQKIFSDVRIICSSSVHISRLVQEGKFSQALFDELKKTSLTMPSLLALSEVELGEIVHGYAEQAIKTQDFKNLLEITEKDVSKLLNIRPTSLQEFKIKVQQLLVQKSKKNNITQEIEFDRGYQLTDPDLVQAARLGKYALRDPQIMKMLWNKFRNQNKIAAFLGVNRSSVNRRCKEHNLE